MVPYIPLELVDLIASFALPLEDDADATAKRRRSKLAADLSLVCRAWRPIGQDYLSRTLELYDGQPDLDSLLGRPQLLANVRQLTIVGVSSRVDFHEIVARYCSACEKLSEVNLVGHGAWSAWLSEPPDVAAHTVPHVRLTTHTRDHSWAASLHRVLSSSRNATRVKKLSLHFEKVSFGSNLPTFAAFESSWHAVRELDIRVKGLSGGQWYPLLQALPDLFLLDRLTSLAIREAHDPAWLLPLLQRTTSLRHLFLGISQRDLHTFALQLSPVITAMTSLESLALRYGSASTRMGGLRALPPSLLSALPLTLRTADLDFGVPSAPRDAVQVFLAQRVDAALERWTATATAATHVGAGYTLHAPVVWVKVEAEEGRRWVLE